MSPRSAGFALSAAVTIVFNTILACIKDAWEPLKNWMGSLVGHNWTAQGIADLVLFFGLGVVFMKTGWAAGIPPGRLAWALIAAVLLASGGLFAWYALF
jgi:hypothetical protein